MNLTKNHVYNIIFWLILFVFMGYKSIIHTINVHEEGVISAYQDYKIQSQARYTFLRFIKELMVFVHLFMQKHPSYFMPLK